jgi:hypothetical protein
VAFYVVGFGTSVANESKNSINDARYANGKLPAGSDVKIITDLTLNIALDNIQGSAHETAIIVVH